MNQINCIFFVIHFFVTLTALII